MSAGLQKTFDDYNHQNWPATPVTTFLNGARLDLVAVQEDPAGRKGFWLAKLEVVNAKLQWVPYFGPAYGLEHTHVIRRAKNESDRRRAA